MFVADSGISGNGGDPWGVSVDWTLIARRFTDKLVVTDGSTTVTIDTGAADPQVLIEFSDGGEVDISESDVGGKTLTVREYGVCDAGVAKIARVLATAPYT